MQVLVFRSHRLQWKAAIMVMMVILRAFLPVMIMVMRNIVVQDFTTGIRGMMTLFDMAGIRTCQDAGIQSDQHAKTHQPCKK